MASLRMALLLLAAVLAVAFMRSAEAQSSTPSCAQKLVPCASYLNSTNPPDTCCNPIREAVATELDCLCNLYNTPGLLESLGINVTQALQLTQACHVNGTTSRCNGTSKSSIRINFTHDLEGLLLEIVCRWSHSWKGKQDICWDIKAQSDSIACQSIGLIVIFVVKTRLSIVWD